MNTDELKLWPETLADVSTACAEYAKAMVLRAEAVSRNKARRIRGQIPMMLPPKPPKPLFPFAYHGADYLGMVLGGEDATPDGARIVWKHHAND